MNRNSIFAILAVTLSLAARADQMGTVTLTATTALNLDTGATSASGGDLVWDGSTLTPQGTAGVFNFFTGGAGPTQYANLTLQTMMSLLLSLYSKGPIPSSLLTVGDVLAVHTNGGNYAKLLVTANSGGSLSLQYTTYTATGGGGPAPSVTAIENAATNIPPGLPNSAIAQGALFVVKGSNLGPATLAIATSFPLTINLATTIVEVTVGNTTVNAILYYTLATQVAAILPSNTPVGNGTLTLIYNGQVSNKAPITVVANNIGVFTLNTTGSGDAVATLPATNTVVSPTNAPNPGETVTLWGTGLGPVTGDETHPAVGGDMPNIPLRVFIGGKPANILYRGRNACCSGVDTIYVTVPQGLTGCANSVIMQIGNLVSNATTIPIGTNGRNCQPISQNPTIITQGTFSAGGLDLERIVEITPAIGTFPGSTTKMDSVAGSFEKVTVSSSSTPPQGSQIDINSYGSCTVATSTADQKPPASTSTSTIQWLDAGNITVAGPGIVGSTQLAKTTTGGIIVYGANLDMTATTFGAGTYTFTGAGGPDVGPFTASFNAPPPFVWTNQSSLATITRANGATFTWTGGDPAGYVTIIGSSAFYGATTTTTGAVAFTCTARVSDGSFTVPPIVLLALPPSASPAGVNFVTPGSLGVTTFGSAETFKASGIDLGAIGSFSIFSNGAIYQ